MNIQKIQESICINNADTIFSANGIKYQNFGIKKVKRVRKEWKGQLNMDPIKEIIK